MTSFSLAQTKNFIKEKWQHAGFQRYLQNTGWLFVGRISALIITFFVNIYIARYLGPLEYGILNYVISFVGLFTIFSTLGIDSILLRELSYSREKRDELMGTSFFLKLFGGFFAIILVFLAVTFGNVGSYEKTLILFYSISFIFYSVNVIEVYFQATVLSKKMVSTQLVITAIVTIYKFFAIKIGLGTGYFVAAYLLDSALLAIGSIYIFVKNKENIMSWYFKYGTAKTILKNSWPLIITSLAGLIYLKIDQVMIRNMLDNYELGIYSAAVKLSEVWYFIPGIIAGSLFPAIINAKKTSIELYYKRVKKLLILLASIAFVIALPVSFISEFIIKTIFGIEYIASSPILSIYIWTGVAVFITAGINQFLLAENKTVKLLMITVAGAIINVILNYIWIPKYGIVGAAFASLISYFMVPLSLLIFKAERNIIINIIRIK